MTIKIWKHTLYRYATPQIIINWLTNQRACKIRGYRTLRLRLERHGIERYGEEIIERSLIGGKPWPYERSQVQSTQAHKYIYYINGLTISKESLSLCWLMTPGLLKTFGVMYDHALFHACKIPRLDIRPHVKWLVSLVIADGYLIFFMGFVWVWMVHTHFITPEVD